MAQSKIFITQAKGPELSFLWEPDVIPTKSKSKKRIYNPNSWREKTGRCLGLADQQVKPISKCQIQREILSHKIKWRKL